MATNGPDTVTGSSGNDVLDGLAGDDKIFGLGGDDRLIGGEGNDELDGGIGLDTADYSAKTLSVEVTLAGSFLSNVLIGGVLEDTVRNIENLIGGSGADRLLGDLNANVIFGGSGNDFIRGGLGADLLDGGIGFDTLDYSDKTVSVSLTLTGSVYSAVTVGGIAEDQVRNFENVIGGRGNDILTGNGSANVMSGRQGRDEMDGGGGTDTADYSDKLTAVRVTLNGAAIVDVSVGGILEDRIRNFENVIGGSAGDTLTGDAAANALSGGGGNDLLQGNAGKDRLDGGAGTGDTASYEEKTLSVAALLNGASPISVYVGGIVEDVLLNVENLIGGSGNDTLRGDASANRLEGRNGDDLLKGGGGRDYLDGGQGIDTADFSDFTLGIGVTLNGTALASVWSGGAIVDTVKDIENVIGGSGGDVLRGDAQINRLLGAGGDDRMTGGGGLDFLDGGTGLDLVDYSLETLPVVGVLTPGVTTTITVGGFAADQVVNIDGLIGGSGNDSFTGGLRLYGNSGDDNLLGGTSLAVIDGGLGNDTIRGRGTLTGGDGNDDMGGTGSLDGGRGNDVIAGGALISVLSGGDGDDVVTGRGSLSGDQGSDLLNGRGTLNGGDGNDRLIGFDDWRVEVEYDQHDTVLDGGTGDDILNGGDLLIGGEGNDTLDGGLFHDTLFGGAGNDLLISGLDAVVPLHYFGAIDAFSDRLDGGTGIDTVDFDGKSGVRVFLNGAAQGIAVELAQYGDMGIDGFDTDIISNVENVFGTASADIITGDSLANELVGRGGSDSIDGGGGNDRLTGGTGNDTFSFTAPIGQGNTDTITDFDPVNEVMLLDNAVFSGFTAVGALPASAFSISTVSVAGQNIIRYNPDSGILIYEADHPLENAPFAVLTPGLSLTAANFIVI